VLVAGELSKNQIFPPIIKLIQGATDINTRYRSFDVVNLALPKPFNQIIEANAKQFKLSPILVRSLMRQESAFNIQAVSTSPAFGLMQLIAPTAEEVIKDLGLKQTTVPDDLFIPDINIKLGSSYIAKMLNRFSGQVPFALAAYNAGPTRMKIFIEARPEIKRLLGQASADPYDELWMDEVPWYETSFYVKAILRNTILYKLADKANAKTPDERKVTFAPVLWSDLVVN
jgi:soluble lytic murein transglycosylase